MRPFNHLSTGKNDIVLSLLNTNTEPLGYLFLPREAPFHQYVANHPRSTMEFGTDGDDGLRGEFVHVLGQLGSIVMKPELILHKSGDLFCSLLFLFSSTTPNPLENNHVFFADFYISDVVEFVSDFQFRGVKVREIGEGHKESFGLMSSELHGTYSSIILEITLLGRVGVSLSVAEQIVLAEELIGQSGFHWEEDAEVVHMGIFSNDDVVSEYPGSDDVITPREGVGSSDSDDCSTIVGINRRFQFHFNS